MPRPWAVRQAAAMIRDLVDVEEAGAGDMRGLVFGPPVAPGVGQVPRSVEYPQIGVLEPLGQPAGRDERAGIIG